MGPAPHHVLPADAIRALFDGHQTGARHRGRVGVSVAVMALVLSMKGCSMVSPRVVKGWAAAAAVFGLLTLVSGGRALFGDAADRAAVGNAVPFVLWFNFLAGFAYVLAAAGLWQGQRWGANLAWALAGLTALVALAFGVQVLGGAAFEMRTVGALALRLVFWILVAVIAMRALAPVPAARAP